MVQSVAGTVTALYVAARDTIYAGAKTSDGQPVSVSYGPPSQYQPNGLVAIGMGVRLPVDRPTMGTNRSREITAEIGCVVSVYVPGGVEAQQEAVEKALDLLSLLENYLRTKPNEALGGACREAWVSSSTLETTVAYQTYDDPTGTPVPTGRVAEIEVTVTASVRL